MTYILRDRPDGQYEIVVSRPVLVGIFPERDTAEQFRAFLQSDEPELADDHPESFPRVMHSLEPASDDDLSAIEESEAAPVRRPATPKARAPKALPAVVDTPLPPAQIQQPVSWTLSDEDTQRAFARLQQGERVTDVARSLGVNMGQLRSKWACQKRNLQKYMASAGPQPCAFCAREFTPSITNPYACARCSK